MANFPDKTDYPTETVEAGVDHNLNSRIFWTMALTTALAFSLAAVFAPWQVASGLLIGGLLSLMNHHWLQSSISAALGVAVSGQKPRITLSKYIFRYMVIALTTYGAYKLRIASLPALLAGLSSFVVALFVEAFRELYAVIIHREEIS